MSADVTSGELKGSRKASVLSGPGNRTMRGRARRLLRNNWAAMSAAVFLVLLCLVALSAPWSSPADPTNGVLQESLRPPSLSSPQGAHLLGTDQLGRDILSRVMHASRISLLVGIIAVFVAGAIGTLVGMLAGFYGGWRDEVAMRLADVQLAFPAILFAIAIVAVVGPSITNVILILGLTRWPAYARTVRASVLSVREHEFVEAARAVGAGDLHLLVRHIFPNTMPPLIVIATFTMANVIVAEASLSFLGLGVQPPTPTWGGMLADGRQYIASAWWLCVFPGLALAMTMLAINTLGDWLRDLLDPRIQN